MPRTETIRTRAGLLKVEVHENRTIHAYLDGEEIDQERAQQIVTEELAALRPERGTSG